MKIFIICLALCFALPASAADFSAKILRENGEPFKQCVQPGDTPSTCKAWADVTLGDLALMALHKPNAKADVKETLAIGFLMERIYKGGNIDLDATDKKRIEDAVVNEKPDPIALLHFFQLLDPAHLKKPD